MKEVRALEEKVISQRKTTAEKDEVIMELRSSLAG